MAASTIPAPGTKFGPCEEPCKHLDCAASRAQAEEICSWCDDMIGYNSAWVQLAGEPMHELCALESVEDEEEAL